MPRYSIIIAVYNRPEELKELLESLMESTFGNFEVIVVEDGSTERCEHLIPEYREELDMHYFYKGNTGQGFSRNFAAEKARGEYLVFFDSDCLIPAHYFDAVEEFRSGKELLFWGGPDAAHESFSILQKAISFTMTSVLTTGGIRGKKTHAGKWQARSFNMGIRKDVFLENGGFYQTNLGEDIELSTRLSNKGIDADLIEQAFVYHKRRNTLLSFFKQTFSFGKGRILTGRRNKGGVKLVHWFPFLFTLALILWPFTFMVHPMLFQIGAIGFGSYFLAMFLLATNQEKNFLVGVVACITALVQLVGYGLGFIVALMQRK